MEFNSNIVIKTNRLRLKLIHEKYIDEININFTKEVTKYMPFNPSGKRMEIENFVKNSLKCFEEKQTLYLWCLMLMKFLLGVVEYTI